MILAWTVVIGVCLYGVVRCFLFEEFLEGCKILLVLPLWYGAQTLFWFIELTVEIQFWENGVALAYYLAGAGLVCYFVIRHVRWLTVPPPDAPQTNSWQSWFSEQNPSVLKRQIAGVIFIVIAAASMSAGFVIAGMLFVIVGVSLIMNVRIWRN